MSTVQDIEDAIEKLTNDQVEELRAWFFDHAISRDSTSGLLDSMAREAVEENRAGRTKEL
jgi:hypothetical protein